MTTSRLEEPALAAAPPRPSGSRGEAAVIAALLPYLRPYLGRIVL
jgi:hypothetical protein